MGTWTPTITCESIWTQSIAIGAGTRVTANDVLDAGSCAVGQTDIANTFVGTSRAFVKLCVSKGQRVKGLVRLHLIWIRGCAWPFYRVRTIAGDTIGIEYKATAAAARVCAIGVGAQWSTGWIQPSIAHAVNGQSIPNGALINVCKR